MSALVHLIAEMDAALGSGEAARRARTLSRITDLFEQGAARFRPEQVELFDGVIQRFAEAIEIRARVELARRLALIPNSPRGVVRKLARDEIAVARTILAVSERLDDQDLMNVALDLGRDHMLAICERPRVSPPVTEVLVEHGDAVVRHAIAGNPGARFSESAVAVLVEHARADSGLHGLLAGRDDLPEPLRARLVDIAEEVARARLTQSLPGHEGAVAAATGRGALAVSAGPPRRDYEPALAELRTLMAHRQLSEADLAAFAAGGHLERTILALVSLTGLTVAALEPIFEDRASDLLLVIGKAQGWSWRTVRALLMLRDPDLAGRGLLRKAEVAFDELVPATAERLVHFLKLRGSAGPPVQPPARPKRT